MEGIVANGPVTDGREKFAIHVRHEEELPTYKI